MFSVQKLVVVIQMLTKYCPAGHFKIVAYWPTSGPTLIGLQCGLFAYKFFESFSFLQFENESDKCVFLTHSKTLESETFRKFSNVLVT
jgi:hypothetical protein